MLKHAAAFSGPTANAILEALKVGLMLVDADSRLVAANSVAADYLHVSEGVREDDGRLVAEVAADAAKLQRDVRAAARDGEQRAAVLRRTANPSPLTVTLSPFSNPEDGHAEALVVVHDPERKLRELIAQARSMFRLSPAEADIAVQLAMGADLDEIAEKRGVSLNTLRAQLAAAMGKAGVRRQAELVGAVLKAKTI